MPAKSRITKADIVWLIAFLLGFGFVLYKCRFGFANIDESYYLTIPYRFYQGDIMCLHEWNLGQTSSVLIYPFFWTYMKLMGSTEGILLAFRYLFTVLHSGTALFIYLKLRKVNWGAGFASVLYLIFTPYGIMALSYNSIALGLLVIASTLLYTNRENRLLPYFFAGLCFAGAVLCCPFLILAYLVYAASVGCFLCRKRFPHLADALTLRGFLTLTAACAVAAAAFLMYLFSKCTLQQFLQVFPIILDDPGHGVYSFLGITLFFVEGILLSNDLAPVVFGLAAALTMVILLDKQRKNHTGIYICSAILLTAAYTGAFLATNAYLNYMMFPLAILGFFCFVLYPRRLLRGLLFLWIPGVLYAFCINMASNQWFYVISNAMCIASLGSIIMMVEVLKESAKQQGKLDRILQRMIPVLLAAFVVCTASIRYNSLFWEKGRMEHMTYEISVGAQKGIFASQSLGSDYEQLYWDTESIRNDPSEKVLYLSQNTWLYLDDTKRNASFSSWFEGDEHSMNKLISYYEVNPDKVPDVVFAEKEYWEKDSIIAQLFDSLHYQREETESGYILTKY